MIDDFSDLARFARKYGALQLSNPCQRRHALMMLCRIKLAWISLGQYESYAMEGC